jgi:hypothetical protein
MERNPLYSKSRKTSRIINQVDNTPSLPQPILSPFVRVGLYNLATGRNASPVAGSGASLNQYYDSLDAQGVAYPEFGPNLVKINKPPEG